MIARNLEEYFGREEAALPEDYRGHIFFTDKYMEGGYGAYSENVAQIIREVYRTDGLPLDMTYTGKAFYGMVKYLEENNVRNANVLFLHTGGAPLFFDFLEQEE